MAPDPTTAKSRGSRYRANDSQYRGGEASERDSQRSEMGGKGKGEKESGAADSGRGMKRRQHGCNDGSSLGGTASVSGSGSGSHRSSKRWRGDGSEALDVPSDRWDGGASDPTKESIAAVGKGKQEIDVNGGDGSITKNTDSLGKEAGGVEKVSRKQRVSRVSLASDNRAITVMDLQESDVSIIDTNIRIKNKVSHRKDYVPEATDSEVEKSFRENMRSSGEMRTRNRWDRDGFKDGADEVEEGPERGILGSEESFEKEKRKEKFVAKDQENVKASSGRRVGEGTGEFGLEAEGRSEVYGENDQPLSEWKIQEDLRNVELEKELENRIRRRREESGDRDRWRDEDRERDVKRHADAREDRISDDRYRDEYSRRDRDRHSDKNEIRQHKEGSRPLEGKLKDDRQYESDREFRPHREERYRDRSKDLDDQSRGDRGREQDHRDRKSRDRSSNYEVERRARDKGHKDDGPERERPHASAVFTEPGEGRSEHRAKRAREIDASESVATEREQSRHAGRAESDTRGAHDYSYDDRSGRSRDDRDADGRPERMRGSPKDNGSMRGKFRGNHWRNDGHASELLPEGPSSPPNTRASPSSNRMDYPSPPRPDDRRSPAYGSQRSPSPPRLDATSGPSRGKGLHGDWFERSNSVSSSNGTQRRPPGPSFQMSDRRDRNKWMAGGDEEVKSGPHRNGRSMDEVREGSLSPLKARDQNMVVAPVKPPLHGQDSFSRGAVASRGDRERWRGSAHGGSATYDGGQLDHLIPDDLSPRDRNERGRRMSVNRPPGSPMLRPQLASLPVPSLAPLPPPPPFRPGIDNPAVLGPPTGGFDDGCSSRDQGRVDRKGVPLRREGAAAGMVHGDAWRAVNMGNWNSRNQGPLPGNAFPPFPPQFVPHSSSGGGGFPGLGQQFPAPPIFPGGGGRPPMDMGFGGRFMGPGGHMGENGDGFLGPGRGAGWHGPGDGEDGRGPPMMAPVDGWEGPGPHGDDRHRHGRMDWERAGPMGVRAWERDREREMWEGRVREGAPDYLPLRSQMEPPLQNAPFPPGAGGWGIPREAQGLNDLKARPERPPYDHPESKRKLDGVPQKMKSAKANGKSQVASEGKRSKYANAAMQSIFTQLQISPELAGPDLYSKYKALLPIPDSEKQMQGGQDEDVASDSADDDLCLEVDEVGEALIAGPKLVSKLLPPLPVGVFQAALEVYRKPEKENKLRKSVMGSFVMPFDPESVKLPAVKISHRGDGSVTTSEKHFAVQQQEMYDSVQVAREEKDIPDDETVTDLRAANMEDIVKDRPGTSGSDAHFEPPTNEVSESGLRQDDMILSCGLQDPNTPDHVNRGDCMTVSHKVSESVAAELEDSQEVVKEEFLPSHVEVAEYSDREFEAEMEETMEEFEQGVAGGEQTHHNSELESTYGGQQGDSLPDRSNGEHCLTVDEGVVQVRSGDMEEIKVGMSGYAEAEGFRRDAAVEGFQAGINLESVTSEMVDADAAVDTEEIKVELIGYAEAEEFQRDTAGEVSQAGINLESLTTEMVDADAAVDMEEIKVEMSGYAEAEGFQRDAAGEGSQAGISLESVTTDMIEVDTAVDIEEIKVEISGYAEAEGFQRDAAGEGSQAGISLESVTEMADAAAAVGDVNHAAESQLDDFTEAGTDNPEGELRPPSVVAEEEDVVPMVEGDNRGEVSGEARFEGGSAALTGTLHFGDAATDVICDVSVSLGVVNDLTGEGGAVSGQHPVTLDGVSDREGEAEESERNQEATSSGDGKLDETYTRTYPVEDVTDLKDAGFVDLATAGISSIDTVMVSDRDGEAEESERNREATSSVDGDLDQTYTRGHPAEDVNDLKDTGVVDLAAVSNSSIDAVVIGGEQISSEEGKVDLEVILLSEHAVASCVMEEANDEQAVSRNGCDEVLPDASVSDDVKETAADSFEYSESSRNPKIESGIVEEAVDVLVGYMAGSGDILLEASVSHGVKETGGSITVFDDDLELRNPAVESCLVEEDDGEQPAKRDVTDGVLPEGLVSGDVQETVGDASVSDELHSCPNDRGERCTVKEGYKEEREEGSGNHGVLPEASASSHDDKETVRITADCEGDSDSLHIPLVQKFQEKGEDSAIMVNSVANDGSDLEVTANDVRLDRDEEDKELDPPEESDDQQLSDYMSLAELARLPAPVLESQHRKESNGKKKEVEEENPPSQQVDSPAPVVEVWKLLISSYQRKDLNALNRPQAPKFLCTRGVRDEKCDQ
ncbi:hypothetical protein R1sor_001111 [Riccia sorocarpa]|uniref:Uncharacterized protein n=1 Tax=Riccia sorocarpa TaxID=122646 RepID=A0ABD3H122_9MARC